MPGEQWKEYKQKGKKIGKYYYDKGVAIGDYYKGKYLPLDAVTDDEVEEATASDEETKTTAAEEDPAALVDEMRLEGMAIGEYYRAKYDPSYGAESIDEPADENPTEAAITEDDWPPWGQDPEEDKAHGIALGQYYKKRGKAIGQFYKVHGKEIGEHYQDYYRTLFDPTYDATNDL
jgi:hypothetical protein